MSNDTDSRRLTRNESNRKRVVVVTLAASAAGSFYAVPAWSRLRIYKFLLTITLYLAKLVILHISGFDGPFL